jgi:hypothetical protein
MDSEQLPLFRGRKCSFRGIPRFTEESISNLGTEGNGMKKISYTKNTAQTNRIDSMFSSETCFRTEFRVVSSAEWFGTEFQAFAYIFVPRNRIPSCFSSVEWFRTEFRAFASNFVPWYRIPSIFLLCRTFRTEFREFSVPRNSRNSAGTNQLFRLFRLPRNNFFVGKSQPYYTRVLKGYYPTYLTHYCI